MASVAFPVQFTLRCNIVTCILQHLWSFRKPLFSLILRSSMSVGRSLQTPKQRNLEGLGQVNLGAMELVRPGHTSSH